MLDLDLDASPRHLKELEKENITIDWNVDMENFQCFEFGDGLKER